MRDYRHTVTFLLDRKRDQGTRSFSFYLRSRSCFGHLNRLSNELIIPRDSVQDNLKEISIRHRRDVLRTQRKSSIRGTSFPLIHNLLSLSAPVKVRSEQVLILCGPREARQGEIINSQNEFKIRDNKRGPCSGGIKILWWRPLLNNLLIIIFGGIFHPLFSFPGEPDSRSPISRLLAINLLQTRVVGAPEAETAGARIFCCFQSERKEEKTHLVETTPPLY